MTFANTRSLLGEFSSLEILVGRFALAAMLSWGFYSLLIDKATIGLYLTPIVGVIFATLFLGERPTPMSALGGVVIIIGSRLIDELCGKVSI